MFFFSNVGTQQQSLFFHKTKIKKNIYLLSLLFQAKIHYLDIISGLPSYGAKCFSTNQRDGVERVLLISPRFGLSQIAGVRNSVVSKWRFFFPCKIINYGLRNELRVAEYLLLYKCFKLLSFFITNVKCSCQKAVDISVLRLFAFSGCCHFIFYELTQNINGKKYEITL